MKAMTDIPMKCYWMGQDIDMLPRETLIEIIHHLNRQLESTREAARSVIKISERIHTAHTSRSEFAEHARTF